MNKTSDRDMETLLRSAAFPNPAHKEALRQRLFGDRAELELDDLALTGAVCAALERIRAMMDKQAGTEPFRLIPALMQAAEIGETRA